MFALLFDNASHVTFRSKTLQIGWDEHVQIMKYIGRRIIYNEAESLMADAHTLTSRAFYWLFQYEYQKIMSTKCIKCLKPELSLNHSSACVHYFQVVIHDGIA